MYAVLQQSHAKQATVASTLRHSIERVGQQRASILNRGRGSRASAPLMMQCVKSLDDVMAQLNRAVSAVQAKSC